ncbi:MAG: AMP-binding protein, partial [Peptococcaceae bacterium]|nr:AMP-binding protein [Peptococcaceae bacterium]
MFRHKDREALACPAGGLRWSYGEWAGQVNRLANALLAWGLAKGDRVAAFLRNTPELATTLFAAAKAGAVFTPVNSRLSRAELTYILNDAEPKVLVFEAALTDRVKKALPGLKTVKKLLCVDGEEPGFAESFHAFAAGAPADSPAVRVAEPDWFSITYTSGTTGRPKGVIHRHREMIDHGMCMIQSQNLTCFDRGLSVAPLYHAAELHCFFLPRVWVGAANILQSSFDPALTWSNLAAERITVLFADPPMWSRLVQHRRQEELPDLRLVAYGGSPMPASLARQVKETFRAGMIQYYGMTEMGPAVTVLYPWEHERKAGSVGQPLLNHAVRVVRPRAGYPSDPGDPAAPGEDGEVLIRGAGMMQGYYNRPEKTARAFYGGWYHSGDLGRLDADGYLWISGRLDDV